MEALSQRLYEEAEYEMDGHDDWSNQALSALYDVSIAAQVYSDALDRKSLNYINETLYELFNLEEAVNEASTYFDSYLVSDYLRENFKYLQYHVQELLYQYGANN